MVIPNRFLNRCILCICFILLNGAGSPLFASEEAVVSGTKMGVALLKNERLVHFNGNVVDLTGYAQKELLNKNTRKLYATDNEYKRATEAYQLARKNGLSLIETRWVRKDGSFRDVILSLALQDRAHPDKGVIVTAIDVSEYKKAKDRFYKAFYSSPAALVIAEIASGRFIDFNERWQEMLGFSKEEMIGRTSKELGIWADSSDRDRALVILRKQGYFKDLPIHFLTKSREQRVALWSGEIITVDGREVLLSLLLDETARKRAEESLAYKNRLLFIGSTIFCLILLFILVWLVVLLKKQSRLRTEAEKERLRFQQLFRDAPIPLLNYDLGGAIGDLNRQFINDLEWTKEDCSSMNDWWTNAFPDVESRKACFDAWQYDVSQAIKTGNPIKSREFLVCRKDESFNWYWVGASILDQSVLMSFLNITEQREAQNKISESETKFREIFDNADDAIIIIKDEIIVDCNKSTLSLFDGTRQEILGNSMIGFSPEEQADGTLTALKIPQLLKSVYEGEKPFFEWIHRKKDGTRFFAEVRLSQIILRGQKHALAVVRDVSARKQAEEALQREQRLNKMIVQNSPAFIVAIDENGLIMMVNKAFAAALEYKRNELEGMAYLDLLVPPEDRNIYENIFRNHKESKEGSVHTNRVFSKHEKELLVEWHGQPIVDNNGEFQYSIFIGLNITERYRAENALRENELRLEKQNSVLLKLISRGSLFQDDLKKSIAQITESSAELIGTDRVSVWVFNEDYSVLRCIDLFKRKESSHTSGDELLSKDFGTYVASHRKGEVIASADVFTDSRTCEIPFSYYKGNDVYSLLDAPIWLRGKLNAILSFEQTGNRRDWTSEDERLSADMAALLSLCFEANERRQAEESLMGSEARYRSVISMSNTGAWEYHSSSKYLWCSPEYFTMLGYNHQDYRDEDKLNIETLWIGFLHPDDREQAVQYLTEYLKKSSGEIYENIFRMKHANGSWVWIWSRGQMLPNADGNRSDIVMGIQINITERKKFEEAIESSRKLLEAKNKELEQLLYAASHDLRTPLVSINAFGTELGFVLKDLESKVADDSNVVSAELRREIPDMIKTIDAIRSKTIQMDKLIKALLKISRAGRSNLVLENLDMDALLQKLLASSFTNRFGQNGIRLVINKLPPCRGDAAHMEQIIFNLLDNAMKYLSNERPGVIEISGKTEEDFVEYRIQDNGIGIEERHFEKIFGLFYRLNPSQGDGDGTGLTVARQLLARMNGSIQVESMVGLGSAFAFRLPNKE